MELFARRALLQGRLQQLAKEELQTRGIQPTLRTTLFHGDRYPATVGLGSELAPYRTCNDTNRHVLTSDGRKQGGHITQPDGNQFLERLRVSRRHGSEAGISTCFERYAIVIHQGEHALDCAERVPEIVARLK